MTHLIKVVTDKVLGIVWYKFIFGPRIVRANWISFTFIRRG